MFVRAEDAMAWQVAITLLDRVKPLSEHAHLRKLLWGRLVCPDRLRGSLTGVECRAYGPRPSRRVP
jgi:hypothetical protein